MSDIYLSIGEVDLILNGLTSKGEAGLDDLAYLLTKENNLQIGWNVRGRVRIDDFNKVKEMIEDFYNSK